MNSELNNAIARCRNLPTPAGIAMRIISLAQDPETNISCAAQAISLDAALTSRILRLANSPLYASRRRIENLNQAITMLGLHATLQLALGFTLIGQPNEAEEQNKAHAFLCKRSIVSSLAARLLGESTASRQNDDLMLAGLLQDIGALALLQLEPSTYAQALLECPDGDALTAEEIHQFGCTHAQIGSHLAARWSLPQTLISAIACSEHIDEHASPFQRCIALSGRIADIWLAPHPMQARQQAQQDCLKWLDIDENAFNALLLRIDELLPEMEELFDTRISTSADIRDLLEQAAEAAQLRQLIDQEENLKLREESARLQRLAIELSDQARRDPLTGVINRRHMDTVLSEAFQLSLITGQPLSIAFIDLDDFKQINDRHGHIIGDHVLKGFTQRLSEQLRTTDIVARYGGEEFVILFPGTSEAAAHSIVRRVLELIAGTPVADADGQPLTVTFSAGIASHGEQSHFKTPEDLLQAADNALYRSKHLGRNRIQAHSDLLQEQFG